DLAGRVRAALDVHRIDERARAAVERRLAALQPGEEFRLLFAGLPYYGPPERFASDARWSVVPVAPDELGLFLSVFNARCAGALAHPAPRVSLPRSRARWGAADSDGRLSYTLLLAMTCARAELSGAPRPVGGRAFRGQGPTPWLAYATFPHPPVAPAEL